MTNYKELCAELLAALKIQLDELADSNRLCKKAEAALAEQARPVIEPVPVSERLPGPEDCDEIDRCWLWEPDTVSWSFYCRDSACDPDTIITHWLPYHALPLPTK